MIRFGIVYAQILTPSYGFGSITLVCAICCPCVDHLEVNITLVVKTIRYLMNKLELAITHSQ